MSVADITQLGIGGVSLFLLFLVWTELKAQNAFNREMLRAAQKERREMMSDILSLKMRIPKRGED